MIQASCLCGTVTFEVDARIDNARYCHCSKCRKFSGTGAAAWGLTSKEALQVLTGASAAHRFDSGGGNRVFCRSCGSPLWYEPFDYPDYVGLPLGIVDRGQVAAPTVHLWTSQSPNWESIDGDLPQRSEAE